MGFSIYYVLNASLSHQTASKTFCLDRPKKAEPIENCRIHQKMPISPSILSTTKATVQHSYWYDIVWLHQNIAERWFQRWPGLRRSQGHPMSTVQYMQKIFLFDTPPQWNCNKCCSTVTLASFVSPFPSVCHWLAAFHPLSFHVRGMRASWCRILWNSSSGGLAPQPSFDCLCTHIISEGGSLRDCSK